jgi:hypothetical protein
MIEYVFSDNITLVLLVVAAALFSWLAVKSKNLKSFQFHVSVFVMIWIAGEVVDIIQENNLVDFGDSVGMLIHLMSMIFLSCMLWFRYYTSKKGSRKMIERLEEYDN